MATNQVEGNGKLNDELVNSKRHCTDSEDDEEELEDETWEDWQDEGDDAEEDCSNLLCLFCDSLYSSCSSLFEHCASAHSFDFYEIKRTHKLDFYKCFMLINYVRSQVAITN